MRSSRRRALASAAVLATTAAGLAAIAPAATAAETGSAPLLMPYYTELDLTGDMQVNLDDLDALAAALGAVEGDAEWPAVAAADTDADAEITVADLAGLSQRMVYDDGPFEIVEATVIDMQAAMNAGVTTSVDITTEYIERIEAYDRTLVDTSEGGRPLASVITVSDVALDAAAAADEMRASSGMTSLLLGVPIAVKDNYNTFDMPTTARGSSGGTGAAIAANLAGIGFGTDTGGSIRVPSSYNQLVGIRPTVGLASRDGIVPLALTQDTGGPMARSVIDAAAALDAVVGVDDADPVTAGQAGLVPESYTAYLSEDALAGAQIGYIPSMLGENPTTLRLWAETMATMEAQGATIVEIEEPEWFATVVGEGSGSTSEFRHDLAEYVEAYLNPDVEARTIDKIIESGRFVTSRQGTYERRAAITEEEYLAWAGPEGSHSTALAEFKVQMTGLLNDLGLDAMVYPSGNTYGTQGRNLRLSPNTGMPAVTVPMGQAIEADGTITGAGVNIEIYGRDYAEGELLGYAYALEQANGARTSPALYGPLP